MPAATVAVPTPAGHITMVELSRCRPDPRLQSRAKLDPATVDAYRDVLTGTDDIPPGELPPAVVFLDGTTYLLASGFHRWHAYHRAGQRFMPCRVIVGNFREALLYSVGCNAAHGLRRTREDERHAAGLMLSDPEWGTWSDAEIARRCKVGSHLVADVRRSMAQQGGKKSPSATNRVYQTRRGTRAVMAVSARPKRELTAEDAPRLRAKAGKLLGGLRKVGADLRVSPPDLAWLAGELEGLAAGLSAG